MFAVYQLLSLCDQKDSLRIIQRIYKLAEQPDPEAGFPFACTAIYLSTLILGLLRSDDLRVKNALKTAYLTILHDFADDSTLKFHYLKFVSERGQQQINALYYGLWLKYEQQWIVQGKNILKFTVISRYLKSFVKEQLNDLIDLADLNSASLSTEHSKSVGGSESGYMKSTVSVMKPQRLRQRLLQTETQQDKTLCTGAKQE